MKTEAQPPPRTSAPGRSSTRLLAPRKDIPWLQEYAHWLSQTGRSSLTIAGYCRDLGLFARWFQEGSETPLEPRSVTATDARLYRQHLLAVRRLSAATVNRHIAALRSYTAWARAAGLLDLDPFDGVKAISEQRTAPRWLDRRQQAALMREVERSVLAARTVTARSIAIRNQAIVSVLLQTGLRVAELCALDLGDVTISERKGLLLVRQGKGTRQRSVPLNLSARRDLRSWLQVRGHPPSPALFVATRNGGRLTPRMVQRILAELGRRSKLRVTPHLLRHTFAKNLIDAGIGIEKVAMLLGHSNLNTTRIYTVPSEHDLTLAVEALV